MNKKEIIKAIEDRIWNYKGLHKSIGMPGALDKWEAMEELLLFINGDSPKTVKEKSKLEKSKGGKKK